MEKTQKVKVYLSGAISGNKNFVQDFKDGEERVKNLFEFSNKDIVILNPTIFPPGLTQHEYMQLSITMIDMCDWVICLPNCENSEGSAVEVAYAKKCGKSVMQLPVLEMMGNDSCSKKKFKVGQKVIYKNYSMHDLCPKWFPLVGTEGIITALFSEAECATVQWERGTTSRDDKWSCDLDDLYIIEDDKND